MRKLQRKAVWCLCALAAWAGPLRADDPAVAIRGQALRVDIRGRAATTTMEITYVNYTDQQREAVFRWRMAADAAVHDLAMWVDGMRSPGAILTRVKARAIYREIVEARRDPALLEGLGGGAWNLRVFPIPPEGTQKVQIVFSQVLQARDGWVTYQGPRVMPPSTVDEAQDFDFSAVIRCPGGVKDIKTGAHKLGVQRGDRGAVTVGFRDEVFKLSNPVVFSYKPGAGAAGPAVFAPKDGPAYFAATFPPAKALPKGKPRPRTVVVTIDTSESMKGPPATAARVGATAIVKRLKPADRFNIVLAGSDVRLWKDKPVAADKENIAAAVKLLASPEPRGGTDLAAGLRAAESFNAEPDRAFLLYVFSDGMDAIGAGPATRPAKDKAKPARKSVPVAPGPNAQVHWFQIAVGEEASEAMAPDRRIFVWTIGNSEDLVEGLAESLAIAGNPMISDVRVACKDAAGRPVAVGISELRPHLPITICGRFDKSQVLTASVSCRVDGKAASAQYRIALPDPRKAAGGPHAAGAALSKVWAHLEAERMFAAMRRGKPAVADLGALIAHSRKHRVLTRATAMLVLENDKDYLRRGIGRKVSFLPEGSTLARRRAELAKGAQEPPLPRTVKRIARMKARAKELRRVGRYIRAAETLDRVVVLDSTQFAARSEAGLLREFAALQLALEQDKDRAAGAEDEPTGPWHEGLLPDEPVELIPAVGLKEVRLRNSVPTAPLIDKKTREKLDIRIKELDFNGTPFKEAIAFLRDASGLTILVRWREVENERIEETDKITRLKMKNVTVEQAMRAVLDQVGGRGRLASYARKGVVTIRSWSALPMLTRVYDVRDLIPAIVGRWDRRVWRWGHDSGGLFGDDGGLFGDDDDGWPEDDAPRGPLRLSGPRPEEADRTRTYDIPDLVLELPTDAASWRGDLRARRTRTSGGLFGDDDDDDDYPTDRDLAETLTEMIRESIAPSSHPDIERASLHLFRGLMVITQDYQAHLAIEKLLAGLRSKLKGSRYVSADMSGSGNPFPEQMFTEDGHITQWVEQLLAAARGGKLSKFSSVRIAEAGGRRFARIGGIWFDLSLTRAARVYLVERATEANAALLETAPDLRACFRLGKSVVVRAGAKTAVTLDELGLSKAASPDLKKIIRAFGEK